MPRDYIPQNEPDIISFAKNFHNRTKSAPESFNLTSAANSDLMTQINAFESAFNAYRAKQLDVRAAREAKDDAKRALVAALRQQAQTAQTSGITNEQRAELGITVPDDTKTPVGAPGSRPVAEIDTGEPLRHLIEFYDNESGSKGKPAGVRGAQIWVKIGGEPSMNEDEYRYLATDTASPYLAVHKSEDTGKQAHYMLRWENTKAETGAWSTVVSATITG